MLFTRSSGAACDLWTCNAMLGVWPPGLLQTLVCLELLLVCKDELSNNCCPTVCAGEHFPVQTAWPPVSGDSCKMIRCGFPAAAAASWAHIHLTLTTYTHRHTLNLRPESQLQMEQRWSKHSVDPIALFRPQRTISHFLCVSTSECVLERRCRSLCVRSH